MTEFLNVLFHKGEEVVTAFFSWLFNFQQTKDVCMAEALI